MENFHFNPFSGKLLAVKPSANFSSFKLRLETFYCGSKQNCWYLDGSNPRSHTKSIRRRLRL